MKKEIAEHTNKQVPMIADDLEKASAISIVFESEGGKMLISGLITDVTNSLETMISACKTLTMQEFVAYCCDIKSKIDLIKALKRSKENKDFLANLLKEEMLKEE